MDGGVVVQQGDPLLLLSQPENDFVRDFFGRSELGVRLLSMRKVKDYLTPGQCAGEAVSLDLTLREALSLFVERRCDALPVNDISGHPCGILRFTTLLEGHRASAS